MGVAEGEVAGSCGSECWQGERSQRELQTSGRGGVVLSLARY